jgi:hypothetical protein
MATILKDEGSLFPESFEPDELEPCEVCGQFCSVVDLCDDCDCCNDCCECDPLNAGFVDDEDEDDNTEDRDKDEDEDDDENVEP